mmetsp:Transcript_27095/g.48982  ORF Transcript_27095/g.48982 Transcript_27095/m.48982 type:complete len:113 (-) Transcript_27095:437-775(-)
MVAADCGAELGVGVGAEQRAARGVDRGDGDGMTEVEETHGGAGALVDEAVSVATGIEAAAIEPGVAAKGTVTVIVDATIAVIGVLVDIAPGPRGRPLRLLQTFILGLGYRAD